MAHGQDSVILLGDAIAVPKAQAEDLAEFDELLVGLKQIGRTPAKVPSKQQGESNVDRMRRTFAENGWEEMTHDIKARIVLALTDSWWQGTSEPSAATLARCKTLFSCINDRFNKLGAADATPAKAGT
jgi:hypothetical protein